MAVSEVKYYRFMKTPTDSWEPYKEDSSNNLSSPRYGDYIFLSDNGEQQLYRPSDPKCFVDVEFKSLSILSELITDGTVVGAPKEIFELDMNFQKKIDDVGAQFDSVRLDLRTLELDMMQRRFGFPTKIAREARDKYKVLAPKVDDLRNELEALEYNRHIEVDRHLEFLKDKVSYKETSVESLPEGWRWGCYEDGSGSLLSPNGKTYFSYDLNTSYTPLGGIEYRKDNSVDEHFDAFWGSFEDFKAHAENVIAKDFSFLGKFNIPQIMGELANNAWYGREPTTVCLSVGADVIKMEGYTYEPSYECFSATSSISFNDKILYGVDSRCVDSYRYETYQLGIYDNLKAAVSHIEEQIDIKELHLLSEPVQVEDLISNAAQKSEILNNDIAVKSEIDVEFDK